MYLFMLFYPFLVLLFFLSCGLVRIQSVSMIVKMSWRVWMLSAAFLAILLRVNRSNFEEKVGWSVAQYHFIGLLGITVIMFLLVYGIAYKYRRVLHTTQGDKVRTWSLRTSVRVSDEELIIGIALLNEFIIAVLRILMNHTFFNWIDVIVVPLIRMSVVHVLILVCVAIDTAVHSKKRNVNTYIVVIGCGAILVIYALMNAITLMLITQYEIFIGMILSGVSVLIGWGTVIYFYCNRKFDDNDQLIRLYT